MDIDLGRGRADRAAARELVAHHGFATTSRPPTTAAPPSTAPTT